MTSSFPTLSDYEISAEIGKGGMGVVYRARQVRLDRQVALKVIRINYLADDDVEVLRRFKREAQAAATLRHPNIVLIYDFDQQDEFYYISMELVEGQSLTQLVQAEGRLSVEVACDYIRQTALGLQHAHEHGMVHRDIKPANLLVQPASAHQSAAVLMPHGTVKILDMGLVYFPSKNNDSQLTMHGTVIGTPDYMAPEQSLDSHCVDIRSDLYSLGCTFYYLLAGKPPFGECKLMQKLLAHQNKSPKSIHTIRPDVPAHVAAVLDKLLAKKQEDRYQTPQEVVEALSQAAPSDDSESIHGGNRPFSIFDTMGSLADAGSTIVNDKVGREPAATGPPAPQRFAVLKRHQGAVTALVFAPSRRVLASGGVDGALRLWSLGSQPDDRVVDVAHPSDITALAFAADSEMLASASSSYTGLIRLWICHGTHAQAAGNIQIAESTIAVLKFSPDHHLLAAAGSDKIIRIWDVRPATPRLLASLKGHQSEVKALDFMPDGQILVSASLDGAARVWDLSKFWSKEQAVFEGSWGQVHSLSTSDTRIALGCLDEQVHVIDLDAAGRRCRKPLAPRAGVVRIVQFNREGDHVLSVSDRGLAVLWDLDSGTRLREWCMPAAQWSTLAVTGDGRYLASGSADGLISLFRFYPRRTQEQG